MPEASCSCWTADDDETWRATGTAASCWTATGRLEHCWATVLHVEAKTEREGVRAAIVVYFFSFIFGCDWRCDDPGQDRGDTTTRLKVWMMEMWMCDCDGVVG